MIYQATATTQARNTHARAHLSIREDNSTTMELDLSRRGMVMTTMVPLLLLPLVVAFSCL
jgi:hypothetical protein